MNRQGSNAWNPADGLPDGLTADKVRGYLDRRAKDMAEVRGAAAAGDSVSSRRTLREIGHRIKGNAALFGLPELGAAAGELVAAVDAGEWGAIARSAASVADRVDSDRSRYRER